MAFQPNHRGRHLSHDAAHSSILVNGDYLYLNTVPEWIILTSVFATGCTQPGRAREKTGAWWLGITNISRQTFFIRCGHRHRWEKSMAIADLFAAGNGLLYSFNPFEGGRDLRDSKPAPSRKCLSTPKDLAVRFRSIGTKNERASIQQQPS